MKHELPYTYGNGFFWGMIVVATMFVVALVCIESYKYGERVVERRIHMEQIEEQRGAREQYDEFRAELMSEARRDEFLEGLDSQDASIWRALVPFAEIDRDCNALPECTEGPTHATRPITVVTRSKHGDVMFIAVLGIETWTPHGRQLIPRSTFYYYVSDRAGALWRMRPGATHGEVRDSRTAEWHFEPASDWVLNEARTALITEWRHRLATQQKL